MGRRGEESESSFTCFFEKRGYVHLYSIIEYRYTIFVLSVFKDQITYHHHCTAVTA